MAVTTTPLGFKKPDGNEPVRGGDNVIADNAQKANDHLVTVRAQIANLLTAAGFPGDPLELNDSAVAAAFTAGPETTAVLADTLTPYSTITGAAEAAKTQAEGIAIQAKDYPSLQAAINATPHGRTLVITGTTNVTSTLTVQDKTITIEGNGGAELVQAANVSILNCSANHGTIYGVSAQTVGTVTSNEGTLVVATTLTLSGSPAYLPGDLVKVVSDDVQVGARPGDGTSESRPGQFMVVHSVSGTTLKVMGVLRDTYTTNVRVAKYFPYGVRLRGVTLSSASSSYSANLVGFTGMVNASVENVRVKNANGIAFLFFSCYSPTFRSSVVEYAENNPSLGQYGYGVCDTNSSFLSVSDYTARYVRHAFTTDSARITADNASLHGYGRTYKPRVSGKAHGSIVTPWDTHAGSDGVHFDNVEATECQAGITLRGRNHKVTGGDIQGGNSGLYVFNETTGGESWGHRIDGLRISGITGCPIQFYLNPAGHPSANTRETRPTYLSNIYVEGANYGNSVMYAKNATVVDESVRMIVPSTLPASANLVMISNSSLRSTGREVNMLGNTAGAGINVFLTEGNSVLDMSGMSLLNTAGAAARTTLISNQASDLILAEGVVMDNATATLVANSTNTANVFDYYVRTGGSNSAILITTTGAGIGIRSGRTKAPLIHIYSNNPTSYTVEALRAGQVLGQTLVIYNRHATATVSVNHGTVPKTDLVTDATTVINPGKKMSLMWNGTLWEQFAEV